MTIGLVPVEGRVVLKLVGELAGILALGDQNDKSRAGGAAGVRSTVLVAGAGNQCQLPMVKCSF
jgi:hypothetical protein